MAVQIDQAWQEPPPTSFDQLVTRARRGPVPFDQIADLAPFDYHGPDSFDPLSWIDQGRAADDEPLVLKVVAQASSPALLASRYRIAIRTATPFST
jgi:hypothetical protein